MKRQKHIKRISITIPTPLYVFMKERAVWHNMSVRRWLLQAIFQKMFKEEEDFVEKNK